MRPLFTIKSNNSPPTYSNTIIMCVAVAMTSYLWSCVGHAMSDTKGSDSQLYNMRVFKETHVLDLPQNAGFCARDINGLLG